MDKYIVQYSIADINGNEIISTQTEVSHNGDENPATPESKDSLAFQIKNSLEVTVTDLKKI